MAPDARSPGRALTTRDLRQPKLTRAEFEKLERSQITVVLDGVSQNYNIGAILRLCDAFLVRMVYVCGQELNLRKRRLVQAARGTEHWVPINNQLSAVEAVKQAKAEGSIVIACEQTETAIAPHEVQFDVPICLVFGSEAVGVSQQVINLADIAVSIPLYGMANSINVASAVAILLYQIKVQFPLSKPDFFNQQPNQRAY